MKKIIFILALAMSSVAFAKTETPKEKSLGLITGKTMSFVMLIEARLKNLLKEVKTGSFLSEDALAQSWDDLGLITVLYKERKLDIFKAYYHHYRTFGRGELKTAEEKRLNKMANEYLERAEEFWFEVKAIKSQLTVATKKFDERVYVEQLTTLGPSLAKQVRNESDREEREEIID